MSDWELADDNIPNHASIDQSDWELADTAEPQETFLGKLPRNLLIGLAHAGRNLHNLPHDLLQGFENATSGLGRAFEQLPGPKFPQRNPVSSYLPYDTSNYANVFGQKGEPTPVDYLIQKGTEYAPDVLGGINALRSMKMLPYLTKYGASKKLRAAHELATERNMGALNVNPELIEDTRQFLPNDLYHRNLLEKAKSGDYQALFDLQSVVGKASRARSGKAASLFSPESAIKGRAGFKSQNALLNDMHEDIKGKGHFDISDLMREGRNDFRIYSKFKPYRNALGVAAAAYMLPKNALIDLAKKLFSHKGE
jgi:hypothetical protein